MNIIKKWNISESIIKIDLKKHPLKESDLEELFNISKSYESLFNKRAVFWLAAQTAVKAGRVDASLKKLSDRTAAAFNGRAPSKTDIFTEGNEGISIKFNCWINASVKVPKL